MIELAILGLLREEDLHGYELRKRLAELPVGRSAISFGSLYPALGRLERAGFVEAVDASTHTDRPRPSSASLVGELAAFRARHLPRTTGRSKKVYGLTPSGDAQLRSLLTDPQPTDERTFVMKVAFCRHLTAEQRLELFERRRAELLARAAERRRGPERTLDRYLRTLRERDEANVSNDLAWLERLIADEKAPAEESPHE